MYKNVQTNPKKIQNLTQHSCCSMLTLEFFFKAIRGNGYHFVPKGGTFPIETIMLVVRSSGAGVKTGGSRVGGPELCV